jgi:hypothetical protein
MTVLDAAFSEYTTDIIRFFLSLYHRLGIYVCIVSRAARERPGVMPTIIKKERAETRKVILDRAHQRETYVREQ